MTTITTGTFISVLSFCGNHMHTIFEAFLSAGWAVHSQNMVDNDLFITFVAGVNASCVDLTLPNAHIL